MIYHLNENNFCIKKLHELPIKWNNHPRCNFCKVISGKMFILWECMIIRMCDLSTSYSISAIHFSFIVLCCAFSFSDCHSMFETIHLFSKAGPWSGIPHQIVFTDRWNSLHLLIYLYIPYSMFCNRGQI